MLVCSVSQLHRRAAIAAELTEAAAAVDAPGTGNVVFATLVDDPASVNETVDAFLGEIMLEAASADAVADAGFAYAGSILETVTAADAQDGTVTASAPSPPLDGTSPTAAWSFSRKLLTAYGGGFYAATGGAITTLNDQAGSARNMTDGGNATRRPVETTAGPNNRQCGDFNGTNNALSVASALPNLISAASGFIVVGAIVDAFVNDSATVYNNDPLVIDGNQNVGILFRNTSGGIAYGYNWDGNADAVSTSVATGTPYVFSWRHEGGVVYLGVNGVETSVASGNTVIGTVSLLLGGDGGSHWANVKIFEAATWQTVPDATARGNIIADFKSWIGA